MVNERVIEEIVVTIKGDSSVGIRDEVISIKDLQVYTYPGDQGYKEYIEDIRRKFAEVFSLMYGEPAVVQFDFEIKAEELEF